MAHRPVGSGVSVALSGATTVSTGIITHFSDTVRVVPLGGDAHVVVGTDPTASNFDYYVPSGGSATLSLGRPKSQKVVGVTTGATTIIDFPAGSGCPFEVGDKVQLTGIVPAGINDTTTGLPVLSIQNGSFSSNSNGDAGHFSTRLTLNYNTSSQGPVTDGEGELKWGAGGYWTCISGPELYYTSGNVGIGTANPAGDLHVSAAGTPCIIIEQSGGSDEDKVLFMMKHQSSCASFTSTSMATPDTGTGRLCGTITGCSAATYEWLQVKGQLTGAQIDFSGCRMGVSSTCACFSGDYLNINGNVGIGTDTASHKLDIDGATHISGDVIIDGGSFTFNESGNSKDFRIEGDNESNLFIGDASTDRVGVGLADPLRRLHVLSSNTVARITNTDGLDYLTYNVMEVDRQDNTAGSGAGIKFNLGNSSSATTSTNYGYIGGVICDNTVGSQCGAVVIGAICDNVQLCTVNITYAGRVGIGTASPSAPLEVIV